MMVLLDIWDPNNWTTPKHESRVYGNNHASIWAIVDEIDYHWALSWKWYPKISKGGKKIYLYRASAGISYYLHVEIMKRQQPERPSGYHVIADHRNGKSLDCQRHNLRWATRSMNSKNKHGLYGHDLIEG